MNTADILILSVLGGVLGLDTVSFPQAMSSRPIVGATLGGAILGDAWSGLLVGAALELFAVETLPFGASRYPEWGSAGVVGGALYTKAAYGFDAGRLTTSVLAALMLAWVGGWSMVQLRKLNAHWARTRHDAVAAGSRKTVMGLQIAGLGADLGRGMIITAIGLAILAQIQVLTLQAWGSSAPLSRAVVAGVAGAVSLGAAWKLFHAVPRFILYFVIGLAAGLVVVVVS